MSNVPDKLINAFLEGELDENQAAQLSRWVMASKENALYIASLTSLEQGLAKHARLRSSSDILAELEQAEDEAAVTPWYMDLPTLPPKVAIDPDKLTKEKYISALMYVLELTFTPKRIVTLAAVAVIALGVLIAVQFIGPGNTDDTQEIADLDFWDDADTSTPPAVAPEITPVATLTATHNAVWGGPASAGLSNGDTLSAGTRLTLTAGFAEITTTDGAVAILEAPATVELLDNNNAIRLHAGKLVGICDTEASKGFLVRTPHMDVTDLGTRFGVACESDHSRSSVLQGEVSVLQAKAVPDIRPVLITAGQGVRVVGGSGEVQQVESIDDIFVDSWAAIAARPELSGPIHYKPRLHADLRAGAYEDPEVRLFYEQGGLSLTQPVNVNLTEPGEYARSDWQQTVTLNDVIVDSYFVHFDMPGNLAEAAQHTVSIRFDTPIRGVIVTSDALSQSHQQIGRPGVAYGNQSDWLALGGMDNSGLDLIHDNAQNSPSDIVHLSDDRRTLTLTLIAGKAIDQVRILVQAKEGNT